MTSPKKWCTEAWKNYFFISRFCFELAITWRPWTFFDFPFMVQVIGIQLYYNNFENMPFRERSYLVDKKKVCIRVAKGLPTPLSLLPQSSKCLQVYHHNSFDCYENHSKYLTIIARGWAKYRDFFVASRSIICQSRRLRQIIVSRRSIIDLRDTDKSRYFVITEYHSITEFVFFNEYPWEAKQSAIFRQERSQEGEKHGFLYTWAEYYLQPNTVGRHCAWADHYL